MNALRGECRVIVVGAMNVDISVIGLPRLPGPDEDAFSPVVRVGGGGKARNIAEMTARLTRPGTTALVSRTVTDRFGLWRVPFDVLTEAGVATEFVFRHDDGPDGLPSIALVAVDAAGRRNSSVGEPPGGRLSHGDIDRAAPLFARCAEQGGLLVLTMETPQPVAEHAAATAAAHRLPVLVDPGGRDVLPADIARIADAARGLFLLKPNRIEAACLSGVEIGDVPSATRAARELAELGVRNVLVTNGPNGAYLFGQGIRRHHIPVPPVRPLAQSDATGCGDQTMAALCAGLARGADLEGAAVAAVAAGTLQHGRVGVQPVSVEEIAAVAAW